MALNSQAMIINTNKKFLHIAIPRTATTCLNIALGNLHHPEPKKHHCTLEEALSCHPEAINFYKFTFVRNPFDRLVSTYFEFRKNRGRKYSGEITYTKDLLSEFDISSSDKENFKNFCRNLNTSSWRKDLFFKPQFDYINISGENKMDYIGKFENLDKDWGYIRSKIDMQEVSLQKNVPREPRGFFRGSEHPPYQEMYSSKEIKVVEELYSKDLEYFNYSFS